jgi:glutathione peroxidase
MKKLTYNTAVTTLNGEAGDLSQYEGDVLLIVNTASRCGLTPQFTGLQELHAAHADQGLRVLGFPCNQFAGQDPGTAEEIGEFCQINYGVDFPMYSKVKVNGGETHPLFKELKAAALGALGSKSVKWNFTKFLVARNGEILRRYAPKTAPSEILKDIEVELGKANA